MKYSLRTLMIVVTLGCVVVGGRIEYLRRCSDFHKQEIRRCWDAMDAAEANGESTLELTMEMLKHWRLKRQYDTAIHPWHVETESVPLQRP